MPEAKISIDCFDGSRDGDIAPFSMFVPKGFYVEVELTYDGVDLLASTERVNGEEILFLERYAYGLLDQAKIKQRCEALLDRLLLEVGYFKEFDPKIEPITVTFRGGAVNVFSGTGEKLLVVFPRSFWRELTLAARVDYIIEAAQHSA